jgi:hypothetical protein
MTTDNFCFYLQNRLIQTSQTGGQRYSVTSHFSIPGFILHEQSERSERSENERYQKRALKNFTRLYMDWGGGVLLNTLTPF